MSKKNSKANADREYFLHRIDEIGMNELDRIRAKAQFERAEAFADAVAAAGKALARLFAALTAGSGHPPHRPASSAG